MAQFFSHFFIHPANPFQSFTPLEHTQEQQVGTGNVIQFVEYADSIFVQVSHLQCRVREKYTTLHEKDITDIIKRTVSPV